MKKMLIVLALLTGVAAAADDLGDARRLLENKDYPQAMALYTRLAAAGNAEAQFHLGEMHWYGEAGQVDLAQAQAWFRRAAAAGSREAAAALETMRQRELRSADIGYWSAGYDGSDLSAGKFHCPAPAIPEKSTTNAEIKQVTAGFAAWHECYLRFAQNLEDAMPPGKRIPADVAPLMNQIEYDRAVAHLTAVYQRVAAAAKSSAADIVARQAAWKLATEQHVTEKNRTIAVEGELERRRRQEVADAMNLQQTIGRPKK